jgi:hypothetical protein
MLGNFEGGQFDRFAEVNKTAWVAAEGIRTLDLLHGKQDAGLGAARNTAANTPLCRASGCRRCPAFTAKSREFPD